MSSFLDSLRSLLSDRGVSAEMQLALDGGMQIAVFGIADGEPKRIFSIAPRPEGVFILGFRDCFRLDDQADAAATITRLATQVANPTDILIDLKKFALRPYLYQKWLDDGVRRASDVRDADGWIQIPDAENEQLWASFTSRFSFQMSVTRSDSSAITVPSPFKTWSVTRMQAIYESDPEQFRKNEMQSREKLLHVCRDISGVHRRMNALSLNHNGYSFEPALMSARSLDSWPVPLTPIHNYSLFADPTFSTGLFCDPWEASICIFGDLMISQMQRQPLDCLDGVIRQQE